MDLRRRFEDELEAIALRRLPFAIAVLLVFLAGALPVELFYFPSHLRAYLVVYGIELLISAAAYVGALNLPRDARAIACAWASGMGLCVAGYYPIVNGEATLALAALICIVSAIPAILPFGVRHQVAFGGTCALGFFAILGLGVRVSVPWPYGFIAFLAVLTLTTIGTASIIRFRWEVFQREASLRRVEEQLRTALGRAESAVELRSRLIANVSHELRTPANVIVGYADMLLESASDANLVHDLAKRIRSYAVSLETLISQLLDLSRLTCGKVDVVAEDVDVGLLLDEVAAAARIEVKSKPIRIAVDSTVSYCRSDPMRLRQILNNLAANAAKFTAEGSIALAARKGRDWVAFQVRDTGCGIPADKHEAIFAPFEQLQPTDDSAHGMGLGLAIVKQLVDLLGGTITVESSPGAGATFTVTLPTPIAPGLRPEPLADFGDEAARGRSTSRATPLRIARA